MDYFELLNKEWESNFFNFPYGMLKISDTINLKEFHLSYSKIENNLIDTLNAADTKFNLIEINVDTNFFYLIPLLENAGFRLVDTKCTYLTLFNKTKLNNQLFDLVDSNLSIRLKKESDFNEISKLSCDFLVNDNIFVSKFKNRTFFKEGLAENYYQEWIKNTFYSTNSFFAIVVDKTDSIKGFFIYDKKKELFNNFPVYKGILTVVKPEVRGNDTHLSMQSFIFKQILDELFYVENATQITNIPVLRNHVKSQRNISNISFILLRRNK